MYVPRHSRLASLIALALLLAVASSEDVKGIKCLDHPLYRSGFRGELIRSWSYSRTDPKRPYFTDSGYFPRYQQHAWAPINDLTSTKYRNLDYFATYLARRAPVNYLTLHFQRKAKVYLLASGYDKRLPHVSLPGWKSEGWAKMVVGSGRNKAELGVAKSMSFHVPERAFVFSKPASENVVLPSGEWVSRNMRGLRTNGYYNILVSEADGSSVRTPTLPSGSTASAGGRCPKELHDAWKVRGGGDSADPDSRDRMFATHHPLWDPCFWCAFDHEHGAAPRQLMGYEPRFGYVALKNGGEDESHNGFKNNVLDAGRYRVYYGIHAHLSRARRFFARFHTVVIAVVEKSTGELLVELSYKADFGFLATRLRNRKNLALREVDRRLQRMQEEKTMLRGMRLINVINPDNLDRRLLYRHFGKEIRKGQYEKWMAPLMCVDQKRVRGPVVDIKSPQTGLRSVWSGASGMIRLGRWLHGTWREHVGVNRDFRVRNMELAFEHCGLGDATGNGVFYTDPYGKKIVPGPAKDAVRQYIKPGTRVVVEGGVFMPDDMWLGLQKAGIIGGMRDVTNAVDSRAN